MGGTFGGGKSEVLSPLIELAFALTDDGTLSGQKDHDQTTVENLLKERMKESQGWGTAAKNALFSGLPEGIPFTLGLVAKLAEQYTGIDITDWFDDWESNPNVSELSGLVTDALSTIFTQSVNLLSMFGDLNFLDPDFDVATAIESFINIMLLPSNLIAGLVDGLIPDDLFGGFDASKIISGEFPMEMIAGLLDILDTIPGLSTILGWFGLDPDGTESDLQGLLSSFLTGDSPLDAFNLFNLIPSDLIASVSLGAIGQGSDNLLVNGGFQDAISVSGSGIWSYNPDAGRTSNGCVRITANGSQQRLLSNVIPVKEGDQLDHIIYAQWSGLVYTGTPFRTRIVRLLNKAQVGIDNLNSPTGLAANQTGFAYALTGADYVVPAGCDSVCYEITIESSCAAGIIEFDDGWVSKTGLLQIDWTQDLPDSLQDLLDGAQEAIDAIFEGVTGFSRIGNLLSDVVDALQNIPFGNVLGIGGPSDIGSTVQETWDQWIGGLVGSIGTGASLSDLFNISQQISSWASKGRDGWDILGIRSNKSLFTGFGSSSSSNISMESLAFNKVSGTPTAPTVPVTQSTALTSWHRVAEAIDIGTVGWTGYGVANLTGFIVNLWKMSPVGDITCTHHSADVLSLLSGTMQDNDYDLPDSVHYDPGDLLGIELHPIGSGTHNVVGDTTWRNFNANVYPRRWSSKRNAGTSTATPSDIAAASVDYGTVNVPVMTYGVSSGTVALPHSPFVEQISSPGTTSYPVPSWVNKVQVPVLGAGGGGRLGGSWGVSGEGGDPGVWNYVEWVRGVHFSGNPILSITVGAGGDGGTLSNGQSGGHGQSTSVTLPATPGFSSQTVVAVGGEGGDALNVGGVDKDGGSAGPQTYDGYPYTSAPAQTTFGADGGNPGTGGAGGNWVSVQPGGKGGNGSAWLRLVQ